MFKFLKLAFCIVSFLFYRFTARPQPNGQMLGHLLRSLLPSTGKDLVCYAGKIAPPFFFRLFIRLSFSCHSVVILLSFDCHSVVSGWGLETLYGKILQTFVQLIHSACCFFIFRIFVHSLLHFITVGPHRLPTWNVKPETWNLKPKTRNSSKYLQK